MGDLKTGSGKRGTVAAVENAGVYIVVSVKCKQLYQFK